MNAAASTNGEPWTRAAAFAFAALVVALLAGLFFFVHAWFDSRADAAIYLLTTKALLAGEGYSYLGQPLIIRPPGLSLLIAPVIALRGLDFGALNLYTSLWGVAAIALLFVWARPRLGWLVACAVCACAWLNPGWQRMCNQTMSDVPGAALLLACLLLERWANAQRSWKRDVVLGLAIGLSAYVRTLIVLLAPAIVIARALSAPRETLRAKWWVALAPLALSILAAQGPWKLYERSHRPPAPDERIGLYDYATGMWHRDPSDPASERLSVADVLARAPAQTQQMLSYLGSRMDGESRAAKPIAFGAALLALALFQLLRRNRVEGWFALLAAGTFAVYFDFIGRLIVPIWLLALVAVAELALELDRRWLRPLHANALVALAFVLFAAHDFAPRKHWHDIEREHLANLDVARRISSAVPATQRLGVVMSGWEYAIYLDRPVWTLFFAWKHAGSAGAEKLLREQHIEAVALLPFADEPGHPWLLDPDGQQRAWLKTRFPKQRIDGDLMLLGE